MPTPRDCVLDELALLLVIRPGLDATRAARIVDRLVRPLAKLRPAARRELAAYLLEQLAPHAHLAPVHQGVMEAVAALGGNGTEALS